MAQACASRSPFCRQEAHPAGRQFVGRLVGTCYLATVALGDGTGAISQGVILSISTRERLTLVASVLQAPASGYAEHLVELVVGVPAVDLGACAVAGALDVHVKARNGVVQRVAKCPPNVGRDPLPVGVGRGARFLLEGVTGDAVGSDAQAAVDVRVIVDDAGSGMARFVDHLAQLAEIGIEHAIISPRHPWVEATLDSARRSPQRRPRDPGQGAGLSS